MKRLPITLGIARPLSGNPQTLSKEQLDLSMPMMDVLNAESVLASENGTDVRNYGVLDGIPEAKELKQIVRDRVCPEKSLGHSDKKST